MKLRQVVALAGSIALAQAAGAFGFLFTASEIPVWYASLSKPALNPPSWVFGPVWTALYLMMAVAAFLVWNRRPEIAGTSYALIVYALQLVLNAIWSPIFFGLHAVSGALVVIILLWLAILLTTVLFFRISRVAGCLMLPYLLWVSFATYLNFSIWRLN